MSAKRPLSSSSTKLSEPQPLAYVSELPGKIASAKAAAAVDAKPPYVLLKKEVEQQESATRDHGAAVVYWMRMQDMRIEDNAALSKASEFAKKANLPLIALFAFSPGDYKAHDYGSRRIDFTIRNLRELKLAFRKLNIPLHCVSYTPRRTLPEKIVALLKEWKSTSLFANYQYEVDELRRDLKVVELGKAAGIRFNLFTDKCVVEPGQVKTKEERPYSIYSPWLKKWSQIILSNPGLLDSHPRPSANDSSVYKDKIFSRLFDTEVPESIPGFESDDRENMATLWPAGSAVASDILLRFIRTKARSSQLGEVPPLTPGAEESSKASRIAQYANARDKADMDTTSRLSPYLVAGVISLRQCIRKVMEFHNGSAVIDTTSASGVAVWIKELAWREFYAHIVAAFPRTSMGRPFQEKFAGVKWETDAAALKAWKEGKTGVPIVDAGMRQLNSQGWMHNRLRMITAMFLTKDLMLDWRLGERYFMEKLLDGDLASNNGGWQWCASTGTDAQPYFRVFNPYLQNEKADPKGDYIRHFVPELRSLRGKAIHDPSTVDKKALEKKMGYMQPIVIHKDVRERAIRRYKFVGSD